MSLSAYRLNGVLVVALLMLCASGVAADEVLLWSGDRLVGFLQRVDAERVIIATSFAKQFKLRRKKVAGIRTDGPVTIVLKRGDYYTGRLIPADVGRLRLEINGLPSAEVPLRAVKGVYRGDPLDTLLEVSGRLSAGLSATSGNSDNENYTVLGEFSARTPQNRYTVHAEYRRAQADDVDTAERALGFIKYDHFLTKKVYWFNSATFERDEFADLNLRTALAAGLGYQFFETKRRTWAVEAGAAYVNQDYEVGEDESFPSARWSVNFEQAVYGVEKLRFFHFQEGLLRFEDTNDIVVRTRTGLLFNLVKDFIATLQANVDWDNDPAPGNTSTDKEYLFTLGYRW